MLPRRLARTAIATLLALWVPLAPAGRATCLAASTPAPAAKTHLRCHDGDGTKATGKPACCCKRVPSISSRNCGCHHGESAWPIARDQAMPRRVDRVGIPLPVLSALVEIASVLAPRATDPPELPPPKPLLLESI